MSDLHHRRSIRLQGYDYAQASAYFVTICAYQRAHLFGRVVDEAMVITPWGQVVQECWDDISAHFPQVELDAFVVMPNHIHGIIVIMDHVPSGSGMTDGRRLIGDGGGLACQTLTEIQTPDQITVGRQPPTTPSAKYGKPIPGALGTIIGANKSSVTRRITRLPDPPDHPIWQRNYYEHVIRDEADLNRIREYVQYNPARWSEDDLYG